MENKMQMPNKKLLMVFVSVLIGGGFFWYGFNNEFFAFQKPADPSVYAVKTIKIGVINDLHAVAIQKGNEPLRLVMDYQRRLQEFAKYMKVFSPEFIVANGDMNDGTRQTAEIAKQELVFLRDFFEKNFKIQTLWTIGNHELRAVNRSQWKESLAIDYTDKAIESGDYKIIFLDSGYGTGGVGNDSDAVGTEKLLSQKQLAWLENELGNSDKIKIVFTHFPPIYGGDIKPGYVPVGAEELQKVFAKHKVAAVFSGHVENALRRNIDGVDYFVLPGISKNEVYDDVFAKVRMINRTAVVTLIHRNVNGLFVSTRIE